MELKINSIVPPICELWKDDVFIVYIKNEYELNNILIQYKELEFDDNIYQVHIGKEIYPILNGGRIRRFKLYDLMYEPLRFLMNVCLKKIKK